MPLRLAAAYQQTTLLSGFASQKSSSQPSLLAVPPLQPSSSRYVTLSTSRGGTATSSFRLLAIHLDTPLYSFRFPLAPPKPLSHRTTLTKWIRSCCSSSWYLLIDCHCSWKKWKHFPGLQCLALTCPLSLTSFIPWLHRPVITFSD